METRMIIQILIVIVVILNFAVWLAWQIKKRGLKDFTTEMIIKAEDMYKKGDNQEKLNYVIDKVIAMIPVPLSLFITRDNVKAFVQLVFDSVKKALDYEPRKEV